MPAFENGSFSWSTSKGLDHACAICGMRLSDSKAVNSCYGTHAEPCPKYHPIMHVVHKSNGCKHCVTAIEQHYRRHHIILKVFCQVAALRSDLVTNRDKERKNDRKVSGFSNDKGGSLLEDLNNNPPSTENDKDRHQVLNTVTIPEGIDVRAWLDDDVVANTSSQTPEKIPNSTTETPHTVAKTKRERRVDRFEKRLAEDIEKSAKKKKRVMNQTASRDMSNFQLLVPVSIHSPSNVEKLAETIHGRSFAIQEYDKTSAAKKEDFKLASYESLVGDEYLFEPVLKGIEKVDAVTVDLIICNIFRAFEVADIEPNSLRLCFDTKNRNEESKALKARLSELQGLIFKDIKHWDTEQSETRQRERSFWRYAGKTVYQRHTANLEQWNWATGHFYDKSKNVEHTKTPGENVEEHDRQVEAMAEAAENHRLARQIEEDAAWVDEAEDVSPEVTDPGAKDIKKHGIMEPKSLPDNADRPVTPVSLPTRPRSYSSPRSNIIRSGSHDSLSRVSKGRSQSKSSPSPQKRTPCPNVHRHGKKKGGNMKQLQKILRQQEREKAVTVAKNTSAESSPQTPAVTDLTKTADTTTNNAVSDMSEVLDKGGKSAFQHRANVTDYTSASENREASFDGISSNNSESSTITTKDKIQYFDTALSTTSKSREQSDFIADEVTSLLKGICSVKDSDGCQCKQCECCGQDLNDDFDDGDRFALRILGQRIDRLEASVKKQQGAGPKLLNVKDPPTPRHLQLDDIYQAGLRTACPHFGSAFDNLEGLPRTQENLSLATEAIKKITSTTNERMNSAREHYLEFHDRYIAAAERTWRSSRSPSVRLFHLTVDNAVADLKREFQQIVDELCNGHLAREDKIRALLQNCHAMETEQNVLQAKVDGLRRKVNGLQGKVDGLIEKVAEEEKALRSGETFESAKLVVEDARVSNP